MVKSLPLSLRACRDGLLLVLLVSCPIGLAAQPEARPLRQASGELPNALGSFRITVPANWNGVVVLDLDFVAAAESPLYRALYQLGYAGAGSSRGTMPTSGTPVDNPERIARQLAVLDAFEREYGRPRRVIAFGRSGAGGLAVAMMEAAPDRIGGSIGACLTAGPIGWFNSKLDSAFAIRTLIAPDENLLLQNLPHDIAGPSTAWREALTRAQASPAGRARIALAIALGQMPSWTSTTKAEPAPDDIAAVEEAMFDTLLAQFSEISAFRVRRDFEESGGGALSWNTGTDYRSLFRQRTDRAQREVVETLYREAGLDLEADLARLNSAPRESANPQAVADANRRLGLGARPTNPVLLFHTSGDSLAHIATLQTYIRRASPALVRTTVVHAAGHCTFSVAETLAAINVLNQRLETGQWPDTSALAMNERARTLDTSPARFVEVSLGEFNHHFYLDDGYSPTAPAAGQ